MNTTRVYSRLAISLPSRITKVKSKRIVLFWIFSFISTMSSSSLILCPIQNLRPVRWACGSPSQDALTRYASSDSMSFDPCRIFSSRTFQSVSRSVVFSEDTGLGLFSSTPLAVVLSGGTRMRVTPEPFRPPLTLVVDKRDVAALITLGRLWPMLKLPPDFLIYSINLKQNGASINSSCRSRFALGEFGRLRHSGRPANCHNRQSLY